MEKKKETKKTETKKTAEDLKERKVPEEDLEAVAGGFGDVIVDRGFPNAKIYKGGLIKNKKK